MMEVTHHRNKKEKPKFLFEDFFKGRIEGHGILQGRSGDVRRRFHLEIRCEERPSQIVLHETFRWSDGKVQKRVWYVNVLENGKYKATAPDCIGEALGQADDQAAQWYYALAIPIRHGLPSLHLQFDDRMFMVEKNALMNVIKMSKFGIHVGSLLINLRKR